MSVHPRPDRNRRKLKSAGFREAKPWLPVPVVCSSVMSEGEGIARQLDAVIARRGKPRTIVSDNGMEMMSMAVLEWCQTAHVEWHYIAPGTGCRMASWKASMVTSGTNASTRPCPHHRPRQGGKSQHGRRTTTETDHMRHWATSHPMNSHRKSLRKNRLHKARLKTQDPPETRGKMALRSQKDHSSGSRP